MVPYSPKEEEMTGDWCSHGRLWERGSRLNEPVGFKELGRREAQIL
jgi:hypothetical protein